MLIKALEPSPEAFSAFKAYEHNFAEVLLEDFGGHFAHS